MAITISWRLVQPKSWSFLPGTSTDWDVFKNVFGRNLNYLDIDKLTAMHLATGYEKTLWGSLAAVLSELPADSQIEVRGEY